MYKLTLIYFVHFYDGNEYVEPNRQTVLNINTSVKRKAPSYYSMFKHAFTVWILVKEDFDYKYSA